MNHPVSVSIIIPVYNAALLIKRCLDSVFDQKGNHILDVIVIDDGSTDNSVEVIRNYPHPVKIIQQPNQGPAAARNRGIENAEGKYLAFLDADDYWLQGFLQETVEFLENNEEAIATSVVQIHKIIGKPDFIAPAIFKSPLNNVKKSTIIPDFFDFWAKHNHVCTGSILIRTEIAKRAGGQRVDLRITQDLEYWAYLATFGKWGFIPKVLFVSDGGQVTRARGWLEKNMIRWASAPSINVWEKRIVQRLPRPLSEGYLLSRGGIAANLAYCMILSSRFELARETISENVKYLPKNRLTIFYRLASKAEFSWLLLCVLLRFREMNRKI
jgi:glycosyltransferase involved in cell wall biosynthesis